MVGVLVRMLSASCQSSKKKPSGYGLLECVKSNPATNLFNAKQKLLYMIIT